MKQSAGKIFLMASAALVGCCCGHALDVDLKDDHIEIEHKSLGTWNMKYPQLDLGSSEKAVKPNKVSVHGKTATMTYDNGGKITLKLKKSNGSKKSVLTLTVTGMPEQKMSIRMPMDVPKTIRNGGTWSAGEGGENSFPEEVPDDGFLYQGTSTPFRFHGSDGKGVSIKMPQWSFQQLQDNRKWKWDIYHWFALVAMPEPEKRKATTTLTVEITESAKEKKK